MVNEAFSIYIHIPFCSKKCPYCHFFVVSSKSKESKEPRYVKALLNEWKMKKHIIPKDQVISVYFGGGTPTELSTDYLCGIIASFKNEYPNVQEVTVEANPESVDLEKIQRIKEAGCNRISLGVQSLIEEELLLLKRQHQSSKAKESVEIIKQAGIDNITIDLMYDIPGQSLRSFEKTLEEIAQLPITHLSLYNLVIEENTPFKRIEKSLTKMMPKQEDSLKMLHLAIEKLESYGLKRYEISAFAKPGFESIHNTGYWLSRPFVGLGPSAFSDSGITRYQNVCNLSAYLEKVESGIDPKDFEETLEPLARSKERFIVNLRMFKTIDLDLFQSTHVAFDETFFQNLKKLHDLDYVKLDHQTAILTAKGADFFEEVAIALI